MDPFTRAGATPSPPHPVHAPAGVDGNPQPSTFGPPAPTTAERQEFGPLTFTPPTSWTQRPLLIMGDPSAGRHIVLERGKCAPNETVPDYAFRHTYANGRLDSTRELVEATNATIAGMSAFRAVFDRKDKGGNKMRETIAWVDIGEGALVIATFANSSAGDEGEVFDEFIASLRLSSPPEATLAPSGAAPSEPRVKPDRGMFDLFPMPSERADRR